MDLLKTSRILEDKFVQSSIQDDVRLSIDIVLLFLNESDFSIYEKGKQDELLHWTVAFHNIDYEQVATGWINDPMDGAPDLEDI